eukprot:TRINITY_DN43947_c0_g1_i1.p1 TRINITY_DN43947_c0_g1~~TRINITY_DN43947_c0_g1_i1.p1  ORF type:complete len:516 (-),score=67.21 TRINITY_DN43947_c0_g1_i1:165-1712(-)
MTPMPNDGSNRSLQAIYHSRCSELSIKPNSLLMNTFSKEPGDYDGLKEIDLNRNLVGKLGVRAVLAVAKVASRLERFCVAQNNLENDAIKEVVDALNGKKFLKIVDLSHNPISHLAGKAISEFVSGNPSVIEVKLDDTLINPALVRIIQNKAKDNATKPPSAEPTAAEASANPTLTNQPNPPTQGDERREEHSHAVPGPAVVSHPDDHAERREEPHAEPVTEKAAPHAPLPQPPHPQPTAAPAISSTDPMYGIKLLLDLAGADERHDCTMLSLLRPLLPDRAGTGAMLNYVFQAMDGDDSCFDGLSVLYKAAIEEFPGRITAKSPSNSIPISTAVKSPFRATELLLDVVDHNLSAGTYAAQDFHSLTFFASVMRQVDSDAPPQHKAAKQVPAVQGNSSEWAGGPMESINLILQHAPPDLFPALAQLRETIQDPSPADMPALDLVFRASEGMQGLSFLSILQSATSTANQARPPWYAIDLAWQLVPDKTDKKWTGLAAVMSLLTGDDAPLLALSNN